MCLILQGTRFQVQVLKPYKSVQETSEEVLVLISIASSTASIYRGLKAVKAWCSIASLIDKLSIEIYEKLNFSSDFHPIYMYMFGIYFLTTLSVYKVILRAVKGHASVKQSCVHANCDRR